MVSSFQKLGYPNPMILCGIHLILLDANWNFIWYRYRSTTRETRMQMCWLILSWYFSTSSPKTPSASTCWLYTKCLQSCWCMWHCYGSSKFWSWCNAKKPFFSCSSRIAHGHREHGMYFIKDKPSDIKIAINYTNNI